MIQRRKENVAYTTEYQEYREKFNYIFCDKYLKDIETKALTADFTIKIYNYKESGPKHPVYNCPYIVHCNIAQLIDGDGYVRYTIKNINDEACFFDLIEHSNGNRYLIFRIDLYGYSILDLATMQDYHYVPEESFRGGETFIWTGTFYNKNTNLLVVHGCYWAAPSNIFVVDFSAPLSLPYPELDVNEYLYPEGYEDIEFENWDGNDNLVVKHYDDEEGKDTVKVMEKELLFRLLKH